MKNTSLIDPSGCRIVKNNQGADVSKDEAYVLAQIVKDMFAANEIKYELQMNVCKERSPEVSVKVGSTGIKFKLGFTRKTTTVVSLTPKGGIFDDYP